MPALLIILILVVASTAMLGVLMVAFVRHMKIFFGSVRRFGQETQPAILAIMREAERAQSRLETLPERGSELKAGARIRR